MPKFCYPIEIATAVYFSAAGRRRSAVPTLPILEKLEKSPSNWSELVDYARAPDAIRTDNPHMMALMVAFGGLVEFRADLAAPHERFDGVPAGRLGDAQR